MVRYNSKLLHALRGMGGGSKFLKVSAPSLWGQFFVPLSGSVSSSISVAVFLLSMVLQRFLIRRVSNSRTVGKEDKCQQLTRHAQPAVGACIRLVTIAQHTCNRHNHRFGHCSLRKCSLRDDLRRHCWIELEIGAPRELIE